MSAGLEIYNANNVLQITEKFVNLQFKGKGTVTPNTLSDGGWRYYDLYLPDVNEQVAFSATNPFIILGRVFTRSNQLAARVMSKVANTQVTYYRFGVASVASGNCFEVYNSNGNLVFTDNAKFMKVIDSKTGSSTSETDNTLLATTNSNLSKAVLPGNLCLTGRGPSNGLYRLVQQGFSITPSAVTSSIYLCFDYGYSYPINLQETNYNYLVLDVTGL